MAKVIGRERSVNGGDIVVLEVTASLVVMSTAAVLVGVESVVGVVDVVGVVSVKSTHNHTQRLPVQCSGNTFRLMNVVTLR